MKGRNNEALFVLARLHAHGDVNDPFVVAEHREILEQVRIEQEETRDAWVQLFTIKSNLRRLLLGVALQFRCGTSLLLLCATPLIDDCSVQMTGVSVIQYYSPQIFASIGIDTSTTLGLQSGNSVIALIGEALCVWYIDRLGRRGPLVWANAISGLTFIIGTILIKLFPAGSDNGNASRAFVAMTWLVSMFLAY